MTDEKNPHPLKGRKQSPEHIAARVAATKAKHPNAQAKSWVARRANGTDRGYKITKEGASERSSAEVKRRWEAGVYADRPKFEQHTPETIEKMREIRRQMWADGRYENKKPATRRAVSKMETSLAPYLAQLGYRPNVDGTGNECFIACADRTRLPDYIDIAGRRVFEFFGLFWHHPEDEVIWVEQYAVKGWVCTVLWEDDLQDWLSAHRDLVSPEDHAAAMAVSRARHRYPERGNKQIGRA